MMTQQASCWHESIRRCRHYVPCIAFISSISSHSCIYISLKCWIFLVVCLLPNDGPIIARGENADNRTRGMKIQRRRYRIHCGLLVLREIRRSGNFVCWYAWFALTNPGPVTGAARFKKIDIQRYCRHKFLDATFKNLHQHRDIMTLRLYCVSVDDMSYCMCFASWGHTVDKTTSVMIQLSIQRYAQVTREADTFIHTSFCLRLLTYLNTWRNTSFRKRFPRWETKPILG